LSLRYEQKGSFLRSWPHRRRVEHLSPHELAYARQRYQLLSVKYPQTIGYMQECNDIQSLMEKSLCLAPSSMSAHLLDVINNLATSHHHNDQTSTPPTVNTATVNPMHTRPRARTSTHTTIPRMPSRTPEQLLDDSDDEVTSHDDQVAALQRQVAEVRRLHQNTLDTVTKRLTDETNQLAAQAAIRDREIQQTRVQAEETTALVQRQLAELESQRRAWQRDSTHNQHELHTHVTKVAQLELALAQAQNDKLRADRELAQQQAATQRLRADADAREQDIAAYRQQYEEREHALRTAQAAAEQRERTLKATQAATEQELKKKKKKCN
jgi:hypothetical protein